MKRVTIELTDAEVEQVRKHVAWFGSTEPNITVLLKIIEALPQPIKVGDMVRIVGYSTSKIREVGAIKGEIALLWDWGSERLTNLVKVDQ